MTSPDFLGGPLPLPSANDKIVADYTSWDLQDGDVLIMVGRSQGTTPGEITGIPTDWFRGGVNGSVPVGDRFMGVFYHIVTDAASEPGVYTFTGVSGGATSRVIAGVDVVRGADLAHVNDGGLMYGPGASVPELSAGGVPFLLVGIWGGEFTAGISVVPNAVPAGVDVRLIAQTAGGATPKVVPNENVTGSRTGIVIATKRVEVGDSTAVPAMTMGWPTAPSSIRAATMMIRGKVDAPAFGFPVKRGDGTPATLTYLDDAGVRRAPGRVFIYHGGFNDVEAFIAKHGATASHRGGSATLPEYSERAYDYSCFKNFGTLEISVAFSGDETPVPFGNGEANLDRMTGSTGSVDPTTLPWATIDASYRNILRPVKPGVSQPLYRLEEMLAKYTKHHVVLVDPKYGHSNPARVAAMIDLCKAIGGPDKIIIKFDSPLANNALINAIHTNGFLGMNYWGRETEKLTPVYGSDLWDLIGIRYDALQSTYDAALGLNKPVWGAVIPDQAGYNTALARGADLMMCANVETIKAVQ